MAFAALIIKEEMHISDRETVLQITENPYMQFFIGLEGFQNEEPFCHTMMTYFRTRFPEESLNRINEEMVRMATQVKEEESKDEEEPPSENAGSKIEERQEKEEEKVNQGKLLVDATCAPADIRYPTDLSLLNEAREKLEKMIDVMHEADPRGKKKPRTYRQKARKDYLAVVKKKRKSKKLIRKAKRQQLNYMKRDLHHIKTLASPLSLSALSNYQYKTLFVIHELYRQQKEMYDKKENRIDDRIVSIWMPQVRPIKRGKARADTEFGAKINVSLVNGFAFAERWDWNHFNEGTDLISSIKNYHRRFGFYPESVHADKIYRNQDNLKFCKKHGIRMSGPALGRPPKNAVLRKEQKKLARQDEKDRIPIEGKFGQGKRRYGLARIMAKLPSTSMTVIAMNLLVMNLSKIADLCHCRDFLSLFFTWFEKRVGALQCKTHFIGFLLREDARDRTFYQIPNGLRNDNSINA